MKTGAAKTPALQKIAPFRIALTIALAGLAGYLVSSGFEVSATFSHKVNICHATSSEVNPYNQQSVDKNSTAEGHDSHSEDIIPQFTYWVWEKVGSHQGCPKSGYGNSAPGKTCQKRIDRHWKYAYPITIDDYDWVEHQYPGKNWDTEGQEIWNNDCEVPEEQVFHSICIENACVAVEGPGESQCQIDTDCVEEASPAPSPTSDGGMGGPVGAPVCTNISPAAPNLLSASIVGANSIKIQWSKVAGVSNYSIFYGPSSGNYLYSVPDTGDTDNFVINGLGSGCFAVKAVNGCAPGPLSNEVCTGGVGGSRVLGASTLGATGSFGDEVVNFSFALGFLLTAFGIMRYAPKRVKN